MSPAAESIASVIIVTVACVIAYKLGHRDKCNEQRARGFIQGWNAAVDAIVPTLDDVGAFTSDVPTAIAIDGEHRASQLRNAQEGTQ